MMKSIPKDPNRIHDQVMIVSAFDRGIWMATELKNRGLGVEYFDLSQQMGNWPPEDVEGPFGFFHHGKLPMSYLNHQNVLSPYRSVQDGLVVWTTGVPFQLRSPIVREQIARRELNSPDSAQKSKVAFSKNWLNLFCHQWGSSHYYENQQFPQGEFLSPYQRDFMIRNPSRADAPKVSEFLRQAGVDVKNKAQILDLSFEGKKIVSGLEIQGAEKGLRKCSTLIWCLTSEETKHLSKKIFKHLYSDVIEPVWTFVRYRLQLNDCLELNVLPEHFNLLEDVFSPWTHAHWMICQRTPLREQLDFWIRIPSFQRFNKSYLLQRGSQILDLVSARLSLSEPEILSYPQEYYYSFEQVGPARWNQYDLSSFGQTTHGQFSNVHFCSPENWQSYQWIHRYESENRIVQEVHDVWQKEEIKRKKREAEL